MKNTFCRVESNAPIRSGCPQTLACLTSLFTATKKKKKKLAADEDSQERNFHSEHISVTVFSQLKD